MRDYNYEAWENTNTEETKAKRHSRLRVFGIILILFGIGCMLFQETAEEKYHYYDYKYEYAASDLVEEFRDQVEEGHNPFDVQKTERYKNKSSKASKLDLQRDIYKFLAMMGEKGYLPLIIIGGVLIIISKKSNDISINKF